MELPILPSVRQLTWKVNTLKCPIQGIFELRATGLQEVVVFVGKHERKKFIVDCLYGHQM